MRIALFATLLSLSIASFAQVPATSTAVSKTTVNGHGTAATAPASKAKVLTRAEFDTLLANPERLLVIDLRRPDEITSVGGFPVFLSIQAADLKKGLAWIPKDRTIVAVSNHNTRNARAADFLSSQGFKVAGIVGAQTYEQEGGHLLKITAPKTSAAGNSASQK
jgi:rhodanese-related sulfurtransferase